MTRLLPAPIFKPHLLAKVYSGDKTQTRRIPILPRWAEPGTIEPSDTGFDAIAKVSGCLSAIQPPYGAPGDFWYFREGMGRDEDGWAYYRLDDQPVEMPNEGTKPWTWQNEYLPSIHMPRDCARRFARVTSVRVERVQDISGRDVLAEGVDNGKSNPAMGERWENMQKMAFAELWDSINAKRGYSWESNPYVWVYTWELVERDAIPAEAWVK